MNAPIKIDLKPTREEIAAKAYQLWEQGGRCAGHDLEYWLQAENLLCTAPVRASQSPLHPKRGNRPIAARRLTNGSATRI
jgi:hypothetical protein